MNGFFKARPLLQIGLGLGLIALLLAIFWDELSLALFEVRPAFVLASAAVSMTLFPLAAARWFLIADALCGTARIGSYRDFLKARVLVGLAGFVGAREVVEFGGRTAWLAARPGVTLGRAAQVTLIDRLSDLYVSGVCFLGALAHWALGAPATLAAALVVLLPLLLFLPILFLLRLRVPPRGPRMVRIVEDLSAIRGREMPVFALSYAKFMLIVARVFLLMQATAMGLGVTHALASVPVGQSIYLISITPGSLGFYELGWAALLQAMSVGGAAIVSFVILLRGVVVFSVVWLLPFFPLLRGRDMT
ncbi:MAG: lysylphosphatidylglycerol synthase domain-containing protein [Roseicyclus sp.]